MILVIDNYDSFTFNLVQYIGEINPDIIIIRNDEFSLDDLIRIKPSRIVISPGPGRPENAGISIDIVKEFTGKCPILGICLGHQAIIEAFGGELDQAPEVCHGKVSRIICSPSNIFDGIPDSFTATRYHSLIAHRNLLPPALKIIAVTDDGIIMGIEHKIYPIWGLQFHPESIMTEFGKKMVSNFLDVG